MAEYYGAIVCESGHCISATREAGEAIDARCKTCGAKTWTKCTTPPCNAPLRGYDFDGYESSEPGLESVGNYCFVCGQPYIWRRNKMAEAHKLLELRSEVEDWDTATKARLEEVMGEIETGSVSGEYVMAAADWLDQRGGASARKTLWEIVKAVGADALVSYVKTRIGIP